MPSKHFHEVIPALPTRVTQPENTSSGVLLTSVVYLFTSTTLGFHLTQSTCRQQGTPDLPLPTELHEPAVPHTVCTTGWLHCADARGTAALHTHTHTQSLGGMPGLSSHPTVFVQAAGWQHSLWDPQWQLRATPDGAAGAFKIRDPLHFHSVHYGEFDIFSPWQTSPLPRIISCDP